MLLPRGLRYVTLYTDCIYRLIDAGCANSRTDAVTVANKLLSLDLIRSAIGGRLFVSHYFIFSKLLTWLLEKEVKDDLTPLGFTAELDDTETTSMLQNPSSPRGGGTLRDGYVTQPKDINISALHKKLGDVPTEVTDKFISEQTKVYAFLLRIIVLSWITNWSPLD